MQPKRIPSAGPKLRRNASSDKLEKAVMEAYVRATNLRTDRRRKVQSRDFGEDDVAGAMDLGLPQGGPQLDSLSLEDVSVPTVSHLRFGAPPGPIAKKKVLWVAVQSPLTGRYVASSDEEDLSPPRRPTLTLGPAAAALGQGAPETPHRLSARGLAEQLVTAASRRRYSGAGASTAPLGASPTDGAIGGSLPSSVHQRNLSVHTADSSELSPRDGPTLASVSTASGAPEGPEEEMNVDEDEYQALKSGEYQVVRRLVNLLEGGDQVKAGLDDLIDKCSGAMNMRIAIMKHRRPNLPHNTDWSNLSELQPKSQSFRKGAEYLGRYCQLIVYAAYLNMRARARDRDAALPPFAAWVHSRSELLGVFSIIKANPLGALAPMVTKGLHTIVELPGDVEAEVDRSLLEEPSEEDLGAPSPTRGAADRDGSAGHPQQEASIPEQIAHMKRRRGAVLNPKTILKRMSIPGQADAAPLSRSSVLAANLASSDTRSGNLRRVGGLPIYVATSPTLAGLRALLERLGAGPASGGGKTVVLTDLREELMMYIGGQPYVRRDLAMPATSLHHAGGPLLALLSPGLRAFVVLNRSSVLSGPQVRAVERSSRWSGSSRTTSSRRRPGTKAGCWSTRRCRLPAWLPPPCTPPQAAAAPSPRRCRAARRTCPSASSRTARASWLASGSGCELIAFGNGRRPLPEPPRRSENRSLPLPLPHLQVGGSSVLSPLEMVELLQSECFRVAYRRVPLSRERTPQSDDLEALHRQLQVAPMASGLGTSTAGSNGSLQDAAGEHQRAPRASAGEEVFEADQHDDVIQMSPERPAAARQLTPGTGPADDAKVIHVLISR